VPLAAANLMPLPAAPIEADRFNLTAHDLRDLPLENLSPGAPVPVDIFVPGLNRADQSVVPTRIFAAGDSPAPAVLARLRQSGFTRIYFRRRDQEALLDYLVFRAREVVGNPGLSPVQQAAVLCENALYLVEAALTLPHMGLNIRRGRDFIQSVVRFVSTVPEASAALVGLLQVDYTWYQHSVNVCLLSVAFGHFLGMKRVDVEVLGLGTLLHDIGKREVPAEVLAKPGPLSGSEREIMRQHPVTGAWTLEKIPEVPTGAVRIVRHHHENMDGTGYPDGLTEVWLEPTIRLIRIVDSYDAVTSNRCYQTAQTAFEGLKIIRSELNGKISGEMFQSFVAFLGQANTSHAVRRSGVPDRLARMSVLPGGRTVH
jgi:putative nucleotidyltransferase with HDIG domain